MTSKPDGFLMADLGITKTHSRPHVFDDNHFRTLNTGRVSRNVLGLFRMRALSPRSSSPGITMNIAIPGWLRKPLNTVVRFSTPLTALTPSASSASRPQALSAERGLDQQTIKPQSIPENKTQ
jgi:hypothetical protein